MPQLNVNGKSYTLDIDPPLRWARHDGPGLSGQPSLRLSLKLFA
ncbi:hypothetical protein [Thiohalophilus thiocyanatoxydans]|uniref:Uncharacterized protein n=1 Tax=Thiohalophilus thiocyanatoxydans TaxID=381308 RepID=A0A4R8IV61_9GAMM|nr:hypothetical protein [Thiohalophilus thiocyanatoxydans]TDY01637.1 hypothetical protein EDC23_1526 [Thiohalophilus thiocyanatoxydans]